MMAARSSTQGTEPGALRLRGVAASRGTAAAPACVIRRPGDLLRVRRGDIIVCASITRDIARTFGLAAGVIAEMGGPLSNRAIMARERGIPAVLAMKDATRRISDGQRIAIDGARGTLTLRRRHPH